MVRWLVLILIICSASVQAHYHLNYTIVNVKGDYEVCFDNGTREELQACFGTECMSIGTTVATKVSRTMTIPAGSNVVLKWRDGETFPIAITRPGKWKIIKNEAQTIEGIYYTDRKCRS